MKLFNSLFLMLVCASVVPAYASAPVSNEQSISKNVGARSNEDEVELLILNTLTRDLIQKKGLEVKKAFNESVVEFRRCTVKKRCIYAKSILNVASKIGAPKPSEQELADYVKMEIEMRVRKEAEKLAVDYREKVADIDFKKVLEPLNELINSDVRDYRCTCAQFGAQSFEHYLESDACKVQ